MQVSFVYFKFNLEILISNALITASVITCVISLIESYSNRQELLAVLDDLFVIANEQSKKFYNKLFRLQFKGFFLVPFSMTMFGIWLRGLFNVFGVAAFSFTYFNVFMFLRVIQFYVVVDGIRIKLELLNEDLVDLLRIEKKKSITDLKSIRAKMEKIRIDYLNLKDVSRMLNDAGTWSILCMACLYTSFLITFTYWFLLSLKKDMLMLQPHESICYIIVTFLTLAVTTHPCSQCLSLVISEFFFLILKNYFSQQKIYRALNSDTTYTKYNN